jgi:hypothetical protein
MTETGKDGFRWRRSSACADHACVEVAEAGAYVYLRDGKQPDDAVLRFSRAEWEAFLSGTKAGDFDAV